jgi:hypothetical protein
MDIRLFKNIIHSYFNAEIDTLDKSRKFLISVKDNVLTGFTKIQTRCLFYSLEIYKFNKELMFPPSIYTICRNLILNTLNNSITDEQIKDYLLKFLDWKMVDLNDYLKELCDTYINLKEIKKYYELQDNSIEQNIIIKDEIQSLYKTVKKNIKLIDKNNYLDNYLTEYTKRKFNKFEDEIKKIYLNRLREELEVKRYDLLLKNIDDIRNKLIQISPLNYVSNINELLDIDYIGQRLQNTKISKEFLSTLVKNILDLMRNVIVSNKYEDLKTNLDLIIAKNELNDAVVICLKTIFDIIIPIYEIYKKYNLSK